MSKKNNFGKVFVIFICICIIILALLILLYLTKSFPDFNQRVDNVLENIHFLPEKETVSEVIPELLPKLEILENPILSLEPFYGGQVAGSFSLESKTELWTVSELEFSITDSDYSITCIGPISRFASDYQGEAVSESSWTYTGSYPILSKPGVFADSVVFIDAEPSLVQLDLITGAVVNKVPSPVYPSVNSLIQGKKYIFQGRDGNQYIFSFDHTDIANTISSVPSFSTLEMIFAPELPVQEIILDKLKNWGIEPDSNYFVAPIVLPEMNVPFNFSNEIKPCLLAFSPEQQGTFTIGLCGEDGKWITANAFIALFTDQGEMRGVSLDYVANQPQIELHVSDTEIYYIVTGYFDEPLNKESDMYIMAKKAL
jgi:hypothetical protein